MEKTGWKVLSIVLIVSQILSLIFVSMLFIIGNNMIENELKCSEDVCFNVEGVDFYNFDEYNNLCQCIDNDNNILHQEIIN